MSHATLVAPLARFRRTDYSLAGGKGANLGELIRAGFRVPPGFVVTTAAYDLALRSGGLEARLNEMLTSMPTDDPASVSRISAQMRALIEHATIPEEIAGVTLLAYHELGGGAVAVRSSATAEDLPDAAYAGQQETFLNVIGDQPLLDAVRA